MPRPKKGTGGHDPDVTRAVGKIGMARRYGRPDVEAEARRELARARANQLAREVARLNLVASGDAETVAS
jgi:hypothetical protein